MEAASLSITGASGQQNPTGRDAIQDVDMDDFLELLITELQNQDPMEPLDNHEILQQLSQIREIESNVRLTETLESVRLGQNLAAASSILGRLVTALTDDGEQITGRVGGISIVDGEPKLNVGEQVVPLKNVSEIQGESTATT